MEEHDDRAFDKIMEIVGNDGKFQRIFNHVYNVGLVCVACVAYMNIVMVIAFFIESNLVIKKYSARSWMNQTIPAVFQEGKSSTWLR